ncbi:MAG: molecular chaperone HtpG, partial [Gammaproteobacteria bacterium]|nr:molecular chaperone HtpG [Gammaproteobacteria bacterium]
LISNASDALDKLRFASLTDESLLEGGGEFEITIDFDKKKRTIIVRDTGIGMSKDEVLENIGIIARSGTKQFVEALSGDESHDANLIGQFGVGFYSVFMVAEKVVLTTRHAGDAPENGVRWVSSGDGQFSLATVTKPSRGTEITLTLRKEEKEYLDAARLRHIISTYSDHISLPIRMRRIEDDKESDHWETVNKGSALWARPKSEITEDEYNAFYTNLAYDTEPPLSVIHNRVEGKLEYISLLFIPSKAPFDLWDRERRHGVKLYVRRIFIMDDTEHLMPTYLRFVRGVVDAADLPLNVSREFLQKNKDIDKIKTASIKKVLGELKKLSEKQATVYQSFWSEFGQVLKEGIIEDTDNRNQIAGLSRFATSRGEDDAQNISLDTYLNRMPAKQKAIYYLTAENFQAAKDSPHLEVFRKNDIEVLLLTDAIDEWLVAHLHEYKDTPLKSIAKGALDLGELGETPADEQTGSRATELKDLVGRLAEILADRVKEVRLSHRLTDSPACLVADEHDIGVNLERILKSMGQQGPRQKPILELNPDHPIIAALTADANNLEDWAHVLFDQAALSEGAHLPEPAAYVRRINNLLGAQLEPKSESRIILNP